MFSTAECYTNLKNGLLTSLKASIFSKELYKNFGSFEIKGFEKFQTIFEFLNQLNKKITGKELENTFKEESVESIDSFLSNFNENEQIIKVLKSCSQNTFNSFLLPIKHVLQTKHNILFKEDRNSYVVCISIGDKIIVTHKRKENIIEEIPMDKVEGHSPMFQNKSSTFYF